MIRNVYRFADWCRNHPYPAFLLLASAGVALAVCVVALLRIAVTR